MRWVTVGDITHLSLLVFTSHKESLPGQLPGEEQLVTRQDHPPTI